MTSKHPTFCTCKAHGAQAKISGSGRNILDVAVNPALARANTDVGIYTGAPYTAQVTSSNSATMFPPISKSGSIDIYVNTRFQEKKDMQDLNERFASYIERVLFLQAENQKLTAELEIWRKKFGQASTTVKTKYQKEIEEAKESIRRKEKEKTSSEILSVETQLKELRLSLREANTDRDKYREEAERQRQLVVELEAEIAALRMRISRAEKEHENDKKQIAKLTETVNRIRVELESETLAHIETKNRKQALEEELAFTKKIHEKEVKELTTVGTVQGSTEDTRVIWMNYLSVALRQIQLAYDQKIVEMRAELEAYYNIKFQEVRAGGSYTLVQLTNAEAEVKKLKVQIKQLTNKVTEMETEKISYEKKYTAIRQQFQEKELEVDTTTTSLKSEVARLQAEIEYITTELQVSIDAKYSLELEITAYRKLLEGGETRVIDVLPPGGIGTIVSAGGSAMAGGGAKWVSGGGGHLISGGAGQMVTAGGGQMMMGTGGQWASGGGGQMMSGGGQWTSTASSKYVPAMKMTK